MMRKTHRRYAVTFWLCGTLITNVISTRLGAGEAVNLGVVLVGAPLAVPMSAGRYASPDIDQRWAPGPPRQHYNWRYHRGFTHRVWFANLLTCLTALLPLGIAERLVSLPAIVIPLFFAPVAGWWSHLSGDMIYGRILILGKAYGLGWETDGLSETYVAEDACTVLSVGLIVAHVAMLTALR